MPASSRGDGRVIPRRARPLAISVSRIVEGKRMSVVVSALSNGCADWLVIGDGRGLPSLRDEISRYSNIRAVGSLSTTSVRRALREADIFVSLGEEEFGIQVHEALLNHVPVIVSADSHVSSLVAEFRCGFIVSDDDPTDIRNAIAQVGKLRPDWDEICRQLIKHGPTYFRNSLVRLITQGAR
ncbi:glycosyltransferase [Nocardia mangyaensis]|uniref:glycosyltransferase n=1 Tax=Nocardia mangyaensis TaxID=2213200 RepID=UPI0023E472E8|nr:glycosyltransferase [Nocardia mangyaensis]